MQSLRTITIQIFCYSLSTPPGTKVRLKGTIPMFIGFILLEPGRVEKLGGKVEKLLTKWETNRVGR